MTSKLEEFLVEQLPDVDAVLAEQGIGLTQRAFRASILIVEHCMVNIEGDTKDDYFDKPWFGLIFRTVNKWYENRYGKALGQQKPSKISAAILVFGTPFQAEIPLLINEPPLPDQTFWVCFPINVQPSENPISWIVNPPNFDDSTISEYNAMSSLLIEAATHLRSTHVNLMTADHKSEYSHSLAQGILPHLEKGALDITRTEPNSRSIAVWELSFACEKAIKTFLGQHIVKPPHTHDINHLHKLAADYFEVNEMDDAVAMIPNEKVVVKHRYAELPSPSLVQTLAIYRAAMSIANGYSKKLSRKIILNNARFQFKTPPWIDQL